MLQPHPCLYRMELELRHWISETVIAEGKKLLRLTVSGVGDSKSKPNYLQGNAKEYDNAMRVHLSGTRAVQIIDVSVDSRRILQLLTDTFIV